MSNFRALETWTLQTVCDAGIMLSIVSFCLHTGRLYFERILSRFTLRVAADLWWVAYITLRDGSLFGAVLCGFLTLNIDVMADIRIALPFVPLGTIFLAAALAGKVFKNTEDVNRAFRVSTWLVAIGALLNTLGFAFVMEAPPPEYAAAQTPFWQTIGLLRSNKNPDLAAVTFYICFAALASIAVATFVKAIRLYGRVAEREQEEREDVQASA